MNSEMVKFLCSHNYLTASLIESKPIDEQNITEYMSELSGLGVNELSCLPLTLSEARHVVIGKTQQLVHNNYRTLICGANCAQTLQTHYKTIEKCSTGVISTVPKLMDKCETFGKHAKQISRRWREVSLMLSKHPQILEVLEIPQLMDTCVRNSHYEEALQLCSYVQRLSKRYDNSIAIIECIANDVHVFRELMMNQLLKELNTNIQLPACLKVIGYLRRMDKFSEAELRIKFLTARDSWLETIIADISSDNPLLHITKVIETNRVHLFDIVTQYRAIFADHDPITPSNIRYYGITNITSTASKRDFNDSSIINSWVLFKVNQFLHILKCDIARCVNNQFGHYYPIESIIEPCFYFGLSLSRIGADFRPQLVSIINEAILSRFSKVVNEATIKFEHTIQSLTLTSQSVNDSFASPSDEMLDSEQELQPPIYLTQFAILAQYCNDMLTAINEIRQTTPLPLITRFASIINNSFNQLSDTICRYYRAEQSALSSSERHVLNKLCDLYINELLPHIAKCFDRICPQTSLADQLGVSVIELNKLKPGFAKLTINKLNL